MVFFHENKKYVRRADTQLLHTILQRQEELIFLPKFWVHKCMPA